MKICLNCLSTLLPPPCFDNIIKQQNLIGNLIATIKPPSDFAKIKLSHMFVIK